jgi:hypothetical protein
MGYTLTFVTDDIRLELPEWFVEKWQSTVYMTQGNKTLIASKVGLKPDPHWRGLQSDLQRVLAENNKHVGYCIRIVFMGNDGKLFKSTIYPHKIRGRNITA